jgi:cell division protein FtsL
LPGYYINGERDKTVCFNRFYLSVGVYDNDVKELEIWGEREIQPDEQKILDEQQQTEKDAQRTHDLSEFERLKKKLNIQ